VPASEAGPASIERILVGARVAWASGIVELARECELDATPFSLLVPLPVDAFAIETEESFGTATPSTAFPAAAGTVPPADANSDSFSPTHE
jgi:hypothetical protein